jgi:two-component system NtrC family response regulator
MPSILFIETQPAMRNLVEHRLEGLLVDSSPTIEAALVKHNVHPFDIVIWDTQSAPSRCSKLSRTIKQFSKNCVDTKTIVIGDPEDRDMETTRRVRCEWLRQPVSEGELLAVIEAAVRFTEVNHGRPPGHGDLVVPVEFEGMVAFTLTMQFVIQHILEAAASDIPVLITGETGTGKDLVAAAIHKRSARKNFPYIPVNMGAISSELVASELFGHERGAYTGALEARPGLFEQAQNGTIFLDEITTMDEKTQVSLLRVLETKTVRRVRGEKDIHVNVRIIAASNENIEQAIKAGRFREDLYYRLDVFRIQLPPLRERQGAISLLTDHFVARFAEAYRKDIRAVSRESYRLIRQYPWPGNVRELKNVIQRAVLLAKSSELTPELLPQRIRDAHVSENGHSAECSPIHLGMRLGEVEKEYIRMTLSAVNGNKMQAASVLGISRRALYNKLKRSNLL